MSRIDRETVKHVALLSRLELSEAEIERYTRELDAILAYMEKLNELDTSRVEPMSHAMRLENVFRPDEPRPSLPLADALSNAPRREGDFFQTPQIIQEM